jgi:hypothetical protein
MLQIEHNKKEKNKELVLEAFDTLFNQRSREGLFNLAKNIAQRSSMKG